MKLGAATGLLFVVLFAGRANAQPAPLPYAGYPGTGMVPANSVFQFIFPPACPDPCPVPRGITLRNRSGQSVVAGYDGNTLTLTALPGYVIDVDSGCDTAPPGGAVIRCAAAPAFAFPTITFEAVPASPDAPPETVTYAAGWNLIGVPDGTVLPDTSGPILAYDPVSNAYTAVPAGTPLRAGTGYWVYFDAVATVVLPVVGPVNAEIPLPSGRYVLVGNPGQAPVALVGRGLGYIFDPVSGSYESSLYLEPGQGAWVYSSVGGTLKLASGLP